jgi:hypothetical protein
VRSLFSGLPDKELRMAIFVSNSDESAGGRFFHHAGLIGPELDWDQKFVPEWQRFVLNRAPKIPYLHMTEIRSAEWRKKHKLTDTDAHLRVNAAVNILKGMPQIFQICSTVNLDDLQEIGPLYFRKNAASKKRKLEADHLCSLSYFFTVIATVHRLFPHVQRVDFVVENKKDTFSEITRLYGDFVDATTDMCPELHDLFGELIPGGKDRVPLQAADLLCWHTQRAELKTLEGIDAVRYAALAERSGHWAHWTKEEIQEFAKGVEGK